MWSDSSGNVAVYDIGGTTTTLGFSGDTRPTEEIPTLVGEIDGRVYLGESASALRGTVHLTPTIQSRQVSDWTGLEQIWEHAAATVRSPPDGFPLLLVEPMGTPIVDRERKMTLAFEQFGHTGCYIGTAPILTLYGVGQTEGWVVDSGGDVTDLIPVRSGSVLDAWKRLPLGGSHISTRLSKLLTLGGATFRSPQEEREVVGGLKESRCFVALEPHRHAVDVEPFRLPNGVPLQLGQERFLAPEETLFRLGDGLGYTLRRVAQELAEDAPPARVALSGRTCLLPGFGARLEAEGGPTMNLKVTPPTQDAGIAAWVGASVVASLSTFDDMLIHRKEYEEMGVATLHRKCP